jgi:hypothetical protein
LTHESTIPPIMTSIIMPAKENTPTTAEVFWKKLEGFEPPVDGASVGRGSTIVRLLTAVAKVGALAVVWTAAMVEIPVGVSGTKEVGRVVVTELTELEVD